MIEVGKRYRIAPTLGNTSQFSLPKGIYSITNTGQEPPVYPADMDYSFDWLTFQVEDWDSWFRMSDYVFMSIEEPIVGISKWISAGALKLRSIAELYGFSKRSGFTLAETFVFFTGCISFEFDYCAISDKTRSLYDSLFHKKILRDDSTDREDKRLYNIQIDLLEMLTMKSLEDDLLFVPEISDIVKRGALCD